MVKAVKERMTINSHPHKQFVDCVICVKNVGCADCGLTFGKAYRLMVCNAIPKDIDAVQLIKHKGVVILNIYRGTRFVWENCE